MAEHSRIEDLRRRVQKDPASIAFAQLAEECRRAEQYQEAVDVCRAGLEIHPGYLSARVTLGRALIELDHLDEAQIELELVLSSAPENLAAIRGLAVDITPLRQSREYRLLWFGELISLTGRQVTVVALPFQVFLLTHSSLAVGMIGLVQVVPLVVASIAGGAIVDRIDRRTLMLTTEFGLAATSALLLVGALSGHPPLWYLYGVTGI